MNEIEMIADNPPKEVHQNNYTNVPTDDGTLTKHEDVPFSKSEIKAEVSTNSEYIFQFCGIAIAAILGAYIRIGIQYYKLWRTETNYVSMN